MLIPIPPDVTSKFVLAHVSEEEIFEAFGLRVKTGRFCAPYRTDHRPDCRFYRSSRNGKLYMRDYAGYFHGDCFDYIQYTTGGNYNDALFKAAKFFKLTTQGPGIVARKPTIPEIMIYKEECTIQVKRMAWTTEHRKFWKRWDFKDETLELFNIRPIERAWVNEKPVFWYGAKKEIAFSYWFGEQDYKLYFPTRTKTRFMHSSATILQGFDQLPPNGPLLGFTKSLKDVAKLHEFSIPAVASMAETQIPDMYQVRELKERFPRMFSLYDIDKIAGIISMQKMKKRDGIKPLFFPRGYPKDFTDFYEQFGYEDTKLLIQMVMDYHL